MEPRFLLSGDVSAKLVNGLLKIVGDGRDNQVTAVKIDGGYRITGREGTTVNGAGQVDLLGTATKMKILFTKGADDIVVDGIDVARQLNIKTGHSAFIAIANMEIGQLRMQMGEHADVLVLNNVVAGKGGIRGGKGVNVLQTMEPVDVESKFYEFVDIAPDESYWPIITDGQAFSIDENSAVDTPVGTVDVLYTAGKGLTFSITAGNTSDAFKINADTGAIAVNNTAALDFETLASFTLTINVVDGRGLEYTESVTVNVNDLAEAP